MPLKSDIDKHQWDSNYSDGDHIDFDVIYEHYRKESRLHDLFEQIIKSLEQIRDSGEVDSKAMMDSLTKIITTLRNSQDGSFLSVHGAWVFLTTFLQNYLWGELEKLPVLGTVATAYARQLKT